MFPHSFSHVTATQRVTDTGPHYSLQGQAGKLSREMPVRAGSCGAGGAGLFLMEEAHMTLVLAALDDELYQ